MKPQQAGAAAKNVDIDAQGNASNVTLSRGAGDQLVWKSHGTSVFNIAFQHGSPFSASNYQVQPGGECNPGAITGQNNEYPYTITPDHGPSADPVVIIKD